MAWTSTCVVPLCTTPGGPWMTPHNHKMRSVSVVLPASTCATMPMFRTFDRGMRRVVMCDSYELRAERALDGMTTPGRAGTRRAQIVRRRMSGVIAPLDVRAARMFNAHHDVQNQM